VRQGHPGPRTPAYRTYSHKHRDALAHQAEDDIPWTVLVDELDGRVHRAYGLLADPTFLLDRDGRVAFYNAITHAPTLHVAIARLLESGGLGVAGKGYDRRVHPLPIVTGGWPAIRRGLPQSAIELELALPGGALLPFVGFQLRGMLGWLTERSAPLPVTVRVGFGFAAGAIGGYLMTRRLIL
jgi:hypothetical protein